MNTYKITNTTHLLGKRDFKANSILDIEYINGLMKQNIKLKPNESVYITINSLPISIHKLRVNGLVTVMEVSQEELNESILKSTPKPKVKQESNETGDEDKKNNLSKKQQQSMRIRNKK